ncbi:MAG: hypothetical protein KDI78_03185, partial [Xanthomonadales bacterium]|nr:hypothetical protein [Xanthomonadales bacterium]
VIKTADWIVDLGPEGGHRGGQIIAEGTPEELAANPDSHTGRFLARLLPDAKAAPAARKKPAAKKPAARKKAASKNSKNAA